MLAHARALLPWAPVPGGVIALVGPAGVLHIGAFGAADLERGLPMTTEHVVQIGSISKVFTALTVVELAARGVLSLDKPITDLLPWLVLGRGDDRPSVRELLSHMGGLVMGADFPPDDLAQAWRLRDSVVAPRPRRFHYSNVGFMLVGLGAAARTGRPWPELVREVLLEPLGMTRSVASITEADRAALAVGYAPVREDRPWVPGDALAPAAWPETRSADGNVAAPAADLAQLVRLLLAGDGPEGDGLLDGRRVVAPGVLDQVTTPTAVGGEPTPSYGPLPQATESTYGLGINIEWVDGHDLLTHGGGMVGFSTFVLVDRTAGFGVVVLTNANGDNLHAQLLARAAHADLVARLEGRSEVELPVTDPRVRVGDVSPEALAALGATLGPAGDPVHVRLGGQTGVLCRTLTGRYVTDHPALRTFHLDPLPDGSGWTHGAVTLRPGAVGLGGHPSAVDPSWAPLVGHYRSYSPWFPHLRVLVRDGRLLLVAPGGVEAPGEEEELVEVDPVAPAEGAGPGGVRRFRVGADPWLPSRLVVGPVVDGHAVSVELDGCLYSRTFTP